MLQPGSKSNSAGWAAHSNVDTEPITVTKSKSVTESEFRTASESFAEPESFTTSESFTAAESLAAPESRTTSESFTASNCFAASNCRTISRTESNCEFICLARIKWGRLTADGVSVSITQLDPIGIFVTKQNHANARP